MQHNAQLSLSKQVSEKCPKRESYPFITGQCRRVISWPFSATLPLLARQATARRLGQSYQENATGSAMPGAACAACYPLFRAVACRLLPEDVRSASLGAGFSSAFRGSPSSMIRPVLCGNVAHSNPRRGFEIWKSEVYAGPCNYAGDHLNIRRACFYARSADSVHFRAIADGSDLAGNRMVTLRVPEPGKAD